jgi:hypothetical protein
MKPSDLAPSMPFLPNAFGKCELEYAAVLVILWHLDNKLETWTRISCEDLIKWVFSSELPIVQSLRTNPFLVPDFHGMRERGFVVGWATREEPGIFSALAIERLETVVVRRESRRVYCEKAACSPEEKID